MVNVKGLRQRWGSAEGARLRLGAMQGSLHYRLARPATSEEGAADILRLRPCRQPPVSRQLLTGCLLKWVTFYKDPETPFWAPWVTILVIQGPQGHPMDTLRPRFSFVIDFRIHFGASLDQGVIFVICLSFVVPKWQTVCRFIFLMIWDGNTASFKSRMCLNHPQKNCF